MGRKSVLVVEDEAVLRDIYEALLARGGEEEAYDVTAVGSVEEASEKLREKEFDVILTDFRLPGRDGVSLLREVSQRYPKTASVMISGFLDSNMVRAALESGASVCLKKPCALDQIIGAIRQALNRDSSQADLSSKIDAIIGANTAETFFIDQEYTVRHANKAFREEYPHCIDRKCYEILGLAPGICPNCRAVAAEEIGLPQLFLRTARNGQDDIHEVQERIEAWRNPDGTLAGLMVSINRVSTIAPEPKQPISVREEAAGSVEQRELMVFALDKNSRIVFADPQFASFCEVPPDKMLGRDITNFLHSYLIEYLAKQQKSFLDFAKDHVSEPVRVDFVRRTSRQRLTARCEFRSNESMRSIGWEILVIATSEEERKLLTKLIQLEKESSKFLLSEHFDMLITLEPKGHITRINRVFEKEFQCRRSDVLELHFKKLLPRTRDWSVWGRALSQAASLKDVRDLRLDMKVGEKEIPVLANIRCVRDSYNNQTGYVIVLRNIEKELKMAGTLASIERMQALGQLAAGTAHQLNNYIVALSGYLEILFINLDSDEDTHSCVVHVRSAVSRLAGLTKHLANYARAQDAPVLSVGNVNDVVQSVLNLQGNQAVKRGLDLTVDLSETLPAISFSPLHLEQAVLNIVGNAMDAVPDGTGTISVKTFVEDGKVCVSVEDNGCGIPEKIRGRIFEAFVSTKPTGLGTGLGLAVAYGIVSSLDGVIDVQSEEGKGTVMTIRLPEGRMMEKSDE